MKKWFETIFSVVYLIFIFAWGLLTLFAGKGDPTACLFASMAFVLGGGDLFHLIPRLCSRYSDREFPKMTGAGKLITSITVTVYYLLLYYVWAAGSMGPAPVWSAVVWGLAAARIVLCCLPGNKWMQNGEPSLLWSVLRNLPFLSMGIIIACLFAGMDDPLYRFMPPAIVLSFLFYLPVVLFGRKKPAVGMLMIPKTLAYVWIQIAGFLSL